MTIILVVMLAVNALLHALVIVRFGARDNVPVVVFTVIYALLAIGVLFAVPYVLWATLILSLIGIVGLTVTFSEIPRDKTLERIIWPLDAITILYVAYLLFAR